MVLSGFYRTVFKIYVIMESEKEFDFLRLPLPRGDENNQFMLPWVYVNYLIFLWSYIFYSIFLAILKILCHRF